MNITGKTIIISGASDGIGRSTAICFAKNKLNLILLGRNQEKLDEVKTICEANGSTVKTYAFDITNNESLDRVTASIKNDGNVDIIINNAGIWHNSTTLGEIDVNVIESVIATNLTSHMLLTRRFIDDMKNRETAIINIVSSAGMQGKAGRTAYAASKFGLRGFTEALRDETHSNTIRIGAVFQGGTNTRLFKKAGEDMQLDRYSNPDDLAQVIEFMLTRPPKLWLNEVHVTY